MRAFVVGLVIVVTLVSSGCTDSDPASIAYTRTRGPIVLVPGLMGFEELLGVVTYFHQIPEALEADGAQVFVVEVSQAQSPEVRGEQIIPQLEEILDETGADRVNLIGHSAGALDARYIAAVRPDLVASVTSVGGPHRGTPVADALLGTGPLGTVFVQGAADLIMLVAGTSEPNDAHAALTALSTQGAAAFNAQYPAALPAERCGQGAPVVDGIAYYSWTGTGTITNPVDLSDPMLFAASRLIPERSDGLVGRCSAHLGLVIRDDYPQNHLDETNLMLGLVGFGPRPTKLYVEHAHRLEQAGL